MIHASSNQPSSHSYENVGHELENRMCVTEQYKARKRLLVNLQLLFLCCIQIATSDLLELNDRLKTFDLR